MRINYITLMVRNMEKSLKFYKDLIGLYIKRELDMPTGRIIFLGNTFDETMIELVEFESSEKVETKALVISYKADEELEIIRKRAISLGYEATEIIDNKLKPKYFTLKDPDGITIEFS